MYKLKEVAKILKVSDRTVERYLKSYFSLENGAYQVSEKMLEVLKFEYLENESDTVVEEFTREEYEEFHKRLVEYSFLKEQLEYHRKSIESHNRQMELILLSITNKKFIEE
jgi:predicted transcriptional regulator